MNHVFATSSILLRVSESAHHPNASSALELLAMANYTLIKALKMRTGYIKVTPFNVFKKLTLCNLI